MDTDLSQGMVNKIIKNKNNKLIIAIILIVLRLGVWISLLVGLHMIGTSLKEMLTLLCLVVNKGLKKAIII